MRSALILLAALALGGEALAQSNPQLGREAGVLHGAPPTSPQDLSSNPGPATRPDQARSRARQQAAQRQPRASGLGRPVPSTGAPEASQPRRATQPRATQQAQPRQPRSQPGLDQRLAEERRRQAAAREEAARAFPGIR